MPQRRTHRITALGSVPAAAVLVVALGWAVACDPGGPAVPAGPTSRAASPVPAVPAGPAAPSGSTAARPGAEPTVPLRYPVAGSGRWATAAAEPPRPGPGRLVRYQVALEGGIQGVTVTSFAIEVTATLDDPRGWTAGGTVRFRRVGAGEPTDAIVHLATPGTRDALCGDVPDGYTSCRNGARIVLNVARWATGVPGYADLADYRRYMVDHEMGHRLGYGHVRCPGPGRPAPVMQQQTLGLHGCRPNPWPFLDGRRVTGPPGGYRDPIPRSG